MERITAAEAQRRLAAMAAGPGRRIVALAGAPGSGKSTLAAAWVAALPGAALLAMDGFHYDDRVLQALGRRARKGAPDTFDAAGLAALLHRLARDDEDAVAVPVFDRSIEIARAGAALIQRAARLIVVEGNWLLLDGPPWAALRPHFAATARLDVSEAVLRARLITRWQGLGLDPDAVRAKVEGNDLPNARLVADRSAAPDWLIGGA